MFECLSEVSRKNKLKNIKSILKSANNIAKITNHISLTLCAGESTLKFAETFLFCLIAVYFNFYIFFCIPCLDICETAHMKLLIQSISECINY